MYILYNPNSTDENTKKVIHPSIDKPGGGGIGGGGSGAANITLQPKRPNNNNTFLFGTILIGCKSKKKISVSKYFSL